MPVCDLKNAAWRSSKAYKPGSNSFRPLELGLVKLSTVCLVDMVKGGNRVSGTNNTTRSSA